MNTFGLGNTQKNMHSATRNIDIARAATTSPASLNANSASTPAELDTSATQSNTTTSNALVSTTNASQSNEQDSSTKGINASTVLVSALTLVSRLLGFVRIAVISAFFGATGNADVLNLVLSVPNNLRKLLAEGALFNAYMPSFSQTVALSNNATPKSKPFFAELLFWAALLTLIIVVLMSYFSASITAVLFNITDKNQAMLASRLFSYAIYFLLFMVLAAVFSGILQTHKRFVLPAVSPIVMSVCTIGTIMFLYASYNTFAVIYGYLLGACMQVLILLCAAMSLGYRPWNKALFANIFKFSRPSTELQTTLRRLPTVSLAVLLPIIGQQIAFYFASTLSTGSSSAFSYAIVYWQLPIGVIINSIINVNYAFLLTLIHLKKHEEIRACISNALEKLCLFVIPVSIIFVYFAHAGVAVTLQRGEMQIDSILLTTYILQGFACGLLPMGFYLFFQKLLYALQKNVLVFFYSLCFTIIDVVLSFILIQTELGAIGLSLAYTASLVIIVPIMYMHIKRYINFSFPIKQFGLILLGMLPLVLCSWFLALFTEQYWYEGSTSINIVRFSILSLIILTILIIGLRMVGINIIILLKSIRH